MGERIDKTHSFLTTRAHHVPALASGLFAAAAGTLGKLAADSENAVLGAVRARCRRNAFLADLEWGCDAVHLVLRLIFLALMISLNGVMVSLFTRSLHSSGTTIATGELEER